jgi:hypothetical protein
MTTKTDMQIRKIWKNTETKEVEELMDKIIEAANRDGHEIDTVDFSEMFFLAFKAGYLAALEE